MRLKANPILGMTNIRGNNDGPGGRNDSYDIGSRKNVPRAKVVKEIESGKHPGAHVYTVHRRKFARDNPDESTSDNVNQGR